MSQRLPAWYAEQLKQEILELNKLLEPLKHGHGGVGDKVIGSLTAETIGRHENAIAELQSILDDNSHWI